MCLRDSYIEISEGGSIRVNRGIAWENRDRSRKYSLGLNEAPMDMIMVKDQGATPLSKPQGQRQQPGRPAHTKAESRVRG